MAHLIPRRPIINNFTHLGPHGIINDILRKKNLKVLPSPINVKYSNKKQRTLEKIKEEKGDKTYWIGDEIEIELFYCIIYVLMFLSDE